MSKGTAPIITCDHEDGCDEWVIDWYEATASNWRELMGGWHYDPHNWRDESQFCPTHAAEVVR